MVKVLTGEEFLALKLPPAPSWTPQHEMLAAEIRKTGKWHPDYVEECVRCYLDPGYFAMTFEQAMACVRLGYLKPAHARAWMKKRERRRVGL